MEYFVSTASAGRQRTDCAIVGVYDKGELSEAAAEIDARIGGRIARLVKRGDLRGKAGDAVLLADLNCGPCERVLALGLGALKGFKRKQYRKALAASLAMLSKTGARNAVSYLSLENVADADAYALARAAVEVVANSQYRIPH